jgi:hypothetical protein
MTEAEVLMAAADRGYEQGSPEHAQWAWYRDGKQASPAYAEWTGLMGWMRDELENELESK